VATQFIRKTQN